MGGTGIGAGDGARVVGMDLEKEEFRVRWLLAKLCTSASSCVLEAE